MLLLGFLLLISCSSSSYLLLRGQHRLQLLLVLLLCRLLLVRVFLQALKAHTTQLLLLTIMLHLFLLILLQLVWQKGSGGALGLQPSSLSIITLWGLRELLLTLPTTCPAAITITITTQQSIKRPSQSSSSR